MLKIYRMAEMAARTKSESLNVSHLTMTHMIHSGKQKLLAFGKKPR
jgi:hypothetical protein